MTRHYAVRAERSGTWWSLSVDGVPFAHSQARRLDQVEGVAKNLLADMFDASPDEFSVEVLPELPESVVVDLAEARRRGAEAERLRDEAAALLRATARRLVDEQHLTIRDLGVVLGVSYQRAQQLMSDRAA